MSKLVADAGLQLALAATQVQTNDGAASDLWAGRIVLRLWCAADEEHRSQLTPSRVGRVLEELADECLLCQPLPEAYPGPISVRKQALARLARARPSLFIKACHALPLLLWSDILRRLPARSPPWRAVLDYWLWHVALYSREGPIPRTVEERNAAAQQTQRDLEGGLRRNAAAIQEAAGNTLIGLKDRYTTRGLSLRNALIIALGRAFVPFFEELTGHQATAWFDHDHYEKGRTLRHSHFTYFFHAVLNDPDLTLDELTAILDWNIFRRTRQG